jgi:hypothetical protein
MLFSIMKATLTFDLPDDMIEFEKASKAGNYHLALWDLNEQLRQYEKYGHNFKTADDMLAAIRTHVFATLEHYFINIDL